MAQLYRNARIHQIFGANTDVGKTVITTALGLVSASRGRQVRYMKPVSTGLVSDSDDSFVARFSHRFKDSVQYRCLHRLPDPVSPHLAFLREGKRGSHTKENTSYEEINKSIVNYIREQAEDEMQRLDFYIETAGGVHSPSLAGISQADSYRGLRLPCLLIGDSKLGGISSTVSSYESLVLRGYTIDAVILFKEDYYRNWEYLLNYFCERSVHLTHLPLPPRKVDNVEENFRTTDAYYCALLSDGKLHLIDEHLDLEHTRRIEELNTMPSRALESIWWPFTQHGLVGNAEEVNVVDSAMGDFFSVFKPADKGNLLTSQFDGSASWWTQTFGHSHPSLAIAAGRAAGRYGHVMFPQAVHLPALKLAENLLRKGPGRGWASRVFFSDDGSTAMEIAIKMALRAYCNRHGEFLDEKDKRQLGILGLKGSYHGDTIGAMDACHAGDGVYTCEWHSAKGFWFDPPSIHVRNGKTVVSLPSAIMDVTRYGSTPLEIEMDSIPALYDVDERLRSWLASCYRRYIQGVLEKFDEGKAPRLAALIIEPLVLGAGGMLFVDPLFQRVLVDVAREHFDAKWKDSLEGSWKGLPVIFDEVFVGLYRVGWQSTIPIIGVKPDIAVYAKMLTGGLLPLSVTLASKPIFEAFLSDKKTDALLHGHSYSAHAIGCEVANESLAMMEELVDSGAWAKMQRRWRDGTQSSTGMWSQWDPTFINELSCLPNVETVMTLGTVLAIRVRNEDEESHIGYRSNSALKRLQSITSGCDAESVAVHYRTLGDVAYFMTSLNTPASIVQNLQGVLINALS